MRGRLAVLLAAPVVAVAAVLTTGGGGGSPDGAPRAAGAAATGGAGTDRATRDLEELVRRGGRLPPEYVPGQGPRAAAARLELAGATLSPAVTSEGERCAEVVAVVEGSAAARAGLAPGDLVLALGGAPFDARALATAGERLAGPEGLALRWRRPGGGEGEAVLRGE